MKTEKHYATREEILASPEETPPRTFRDPGNVLRIIEKMMADAEPPDNPNLGWAAQALLSQPGGFYSDQARDTAASLGSLRLSADSQAIVEKREIHESRSQCDCSRRRKLQ